MWDRISQSTSPPHLNSSVAVSPPVSAIAAKVSAAASKMSIFCAKSLMVATVEPMTIFLSSLRRNQRRLVSRASNLPMTAVGRKVGHSFSGEASILPHAV